MDTAKFICTQLNGKEIILMGFSDNSTMFEKMYNIFYECSFIESLYCKIAPITRENKDFVVDY